jgi:hypothetical protein
MEKRLTRSDFVFILVFIFMLIFALGTFFFGVKIGTDRTELKYADLVKQKREERDGLSAYHQSYLVSFYHTVYLPFREFNLKWAQNMEQIESEISGTDASSLLKGLSKLADVQYEGMLTQTVPETSPLLVDAHEEYLKSLKLFSQAANSMQSKANNVAPTLLISEINKDAYMTEAKNFALSAQKKYYDAIVLWHQSMDSAAKGTDSIPSGDLVFNDWSQMDLNLKNAYIAGLFIPGKSFYAFTPQDVTLRVDEMIRSGQAKKLNAENVSQVVDILISTHAVRQGDFVQGKAKFYGGELLPQLPFFSKME